MLRDALTAKAADEMEQVAKAIAPTMIIDASGYDRVLQLFFTRAVQCFGAIRLLAHQGMGVDALILVRALYEQAVNILYIATDPERLAVRYLNYGHYRNWSYWCFLRRHYPEAAARLDPAAVREIRRQYARVHKDYRRGRTWHGQAIADLARRVDLWKTHETFYRITCDIAHGSVAGLFPLLMAAEARLGVPTEKVEEDYAEESLELGIYCLVPILEEVNRHFGLDYGTRLSSIRERLRCRS